jgi:hypothetical protein
LVGCYICNIDKPEMAITNLGLLLIPQKNNIECDCKLIMVGTLKDTRKRKYQEEFLKYAFTSIVINGEEKLQCVVCCEVLTMSHSR